MKQIVALNEMLCKVMKYILKYSKLLESEICKRKNQVLERI